MAQAKNNTGVIIGIVVAIVIIVGAYFVLGGNTAVAPEGAAMEAPAAAAPAPEAAPAPAPAQ